MAQEIKVQPPQGKNVVPHVREILISGLGDRKDIYGVLEFGSAARGKANPNDYDMIIVANYNFTIPRELYQHLSKVTLDVYKETNMRVEMLVRDRALLPTMFSTFGPAFRTHLAGEGKILFGEDPRPLFTNSYSESLAKLIAGMPSDQFGLFVGGFRLGEA